MSRDLVVQGFTMGRSRSNEYEVNRMNGIMHFAVLHPIATYCPVWYRRAQSGRTSNQGHPFSCVSCELQASVLNRVRRYKIQQ